MEKVDRGGGVDKTGRFLHTLKGPVHSVGVKMD